MAKSLRSKFKRKMKAIARVKKAPKELKKLEETLATKTIVEINKAVTEAKEAAMEVQSTETATINIKTMKKADGSYPAWLNQRKVKKAKAVEKKKKAMIRHQRAH